MSNKFPQYPQGKAILFKGPGKPFEVINKDVTGITLKEVLVKNLYTTLCGSDIHTYCGHRAEAEQVVLGHEIVGEVLWFDDEQELKDLNGELIQIGDRIVWSIFAVPEGVEAPRADMPQKSEQLFKYGHALATEQDIFNGGMADYCILKPNTAFLKISTDVPLKVAATISCAHSTVMGALRVAGDIMEKKVLIVGAGLLGISCAAMCREAGAKWIGLVDNDLSRLHWGPKFGTDETYLFPENTNAILPWPEADVVFDMTGSPKAMKTGIDSLALGGCAVWIGAVSPVDAVPVDAQKIVRKLLTIKGLHNYNYQDFTNATAFIVKEHIKYPFSELIEKEYPLDNVEEAFQFAIENKPVRVGIHIK